MSQTFTAICWTKVILHFTVLFCVSILHYIINALANMSLFLFFKFCFHNVLVASAIYMVIFNPVSVSACVLTL